MKYLYHEKIGYVDASVIQTIEVVHSPFIDNATEVYYGPYGARTSCTMFITKEDAADFAEWMAKEVERLTE